MPGAIVYPEKSVRKETFHTLSFVRPALEPGSSVLDIGCGGGFVLAELASEHEVSGVDIVDLRAVDLPRFQLYDGLCVPCADDSVDVVLLTFVLHHVPNESKGILLNEARRVARRRIVVLEDTPRTPFDRLACDLHGRLYRRRIGSTASYGFYGQTDWEAFFENHGLTVMRSISLPRFGRDWLRPWARSAFVLDKCRATQTR